MKPITFKHQFSPSLSIQYLLGILLLATLIGCASTKTRLITLNQSYHYDRETPFNERHDGVGLDWEFDKFWRMGYINFKNSQYCCGRDRSNMIFATREWNPGGDNLYMGISWFAADGYGRDQEDIFWLGGITFRYEFSPSLSIYSIVTPVVAVDGLMLQWQDDE